MLHLVYNDVKHRKTTELCIFETLDMRTQHKWLPNVLPVKYLLIWGWTTVEWLVMISVNLLSLTYK